MNNELIEAEQNKQTGIAELQALSASLLRKGFLMDAQRIDRVNAALSAKPEQTLTDIYIAKLTAAHAAELAAMLAAEDTEMKRLKGLLTIYFKAQQEESK